MKGIIFAGAFIGAYAAFGATIAKVLLAIVAATFAGVTF